MAEVLMRLLTLQSVEYGDIDVEKEMFELNGIMSELNVGNELPERPISYEQVKRYTLLNQLRVFSHFAFS
jgi:hypothetical protein